MANFDTTFWARVDKSSANNPEINLEPVQNLPAIEITFVADADPSTGFAPGDLLLDNLNGVFDPNTVVEIGGTQYNFSVEFTGGMPSGNAKVPLDLQGQTGMLITVIDYPSAGETTRLFFFPEADPSEALMNGIGGGSIPLTNLKTDPPPPQICFVAGTLFHTPNGPRCIEDLRVGDHVETLDKGMQPITWVSSTIMSWPGAVEDQKPIKFSPGSLGHDAPKRDLCVSPQHRVLISNEICEDLFGTSEVLAPAKGLTGLPGVRVMKGLRTVEYFHVLLASHCLLKAEGGIAESFYPGPTALRMLPPAQRASLFAAVPALKTDPENGYGPTARKKITRREAEKLVAAILADRKAKAIAAE